MSNVIYTNMTNLQKFSKNLQDPKLQPEIYKLYDQKRPLYDHIENVILDPEYNRKNIKMRMKDCPDHPSNENHPDYDPNKIW